MLRGAPLCLTMLHHILQAVDDILTGNDRLLLILLGFLHQPVTAFLTLLWCQCQPDLCILCGDTDGLTHRDVEEDAGMFRLVVAVHPCGDIFLIVQSGDFMQRIIQPCVQLILETQRLFMRLCNKAKMPVCELSTQFLAECHHQLAIAHEAHAELLDLGQIVRFLLAVILLACRLHLG